MNELQEIQDAGLPERELCDRSEEDGYERLPEPIHDLQCNLKPTGPVEMIPIDVYTTQHNYETVDGNSVSSTETYEDTVVRSDVSVDGNSVISVQDTVAKESQELATGAINQEPCMTVVTEYYSFPECFVAQVAGKGPVTEYSIAEELSLEPIVDHSLID